MQQDEIIINGPLVTRALRRQIRRWIWIGSLLFALLLIGLLCLVPRSYTSTVSIAIQQPSGGSSPLAALAGIGGASKRYIGVLKSRDLAASVERHVGLRSLYGPKTFPKEEDAAETLMKSVKPDDNAADGLLYVSVTLPGSPKLGLNHSPSQTQIEEAAALAANAYALALKQYYVANDTDQSSVLLRDAEKEVRQARAGYNASQAQVRDFSRGLSHLDSRSAPASPSGNSAASGVSEDAAVAVSGLGTLYASLNQVQAELRASQAARLTRESLTAEQLRDLSNIPTDDPLLGDARTRVTQDKTAYETASRLYGPENPVVVRARTQLEADQRQLNLQIQGVKARLTTPSIRSDEQIQALYARQSYLVRQISQAERRLGTSRELSGELGRLRAEVAFRADILRETLIGAAKIRLENASAQSRMTIIDAALPSKSGEPGVVRLALICVALVLVAFCVALVRDYVRLAQSEKLAVSATDSSSNGADPAAHAEGEDAMARPSLRKQ